MHEVCERAVTQEEMQRISASVMKLQPGEEPPRYDPDYVCPLSVVEEHFVDHTIELEESKSYPGLQTMYHLYTVDILCTGLPKVDFNTLEFDHPREGEPKLKYIHAWAWLSWSEIKRYLFEGSVLKETKKKGSFPDVAALKAWLTQFDVNISKWTHTPDELFKEIENEESQLQLWGRHDGVPLLMRVVHVIQLKIHAVDARHARRILLETRRQTKSSELRVTNRLPSKKQSTKHLPFDEARFIACAKDITASSFKYIADATYKVCPGQTPNESDFEKVKVEVQNARFVEKHTDIQDSPSFQGMHTMYHLYAMLVDVDGLPLTNFTSLTFKRDPSCPDGPQFHSLQAWEWASWEQILDLVHTQSSYLETCKLDAQAVNRMQSKRLETCSTLVNDLGIILQRLTDVAPGSRDLKDANLLFTKMQCAVNDTCSDTTKFEQFALQQQALPNIIPPSMASKMSTATLAQDELVEDAQKKNVKVAEIQLKDWTPESPTV